MVALTLIQPWASLVIHHGKSVENRSWPTNHRGPLLIHAGKKTDPAGFALAEELGIYLPDDLPAGGIIGRVQVVGCVRDSDSPWAMSGQWHWQLADPEPLAFEPLRGQMGLFKVGAEDETDQARLFA
jgi:hypothetical protein